MLLRLIACNVFFREACLCAAHTPHVVDVEFTELGEHVHPEALRGKIQGMIDAAERSGKGYEAILLLFGICGNAGVGLCARNTPLVIPRAHDCCTILLGSRQRFQEHFGDNPSTPFSSPGYMERGSYFLRAEDGETKVYYGDIYAQYVEQYGEDNARYIMEAMAPRRKGEGPERAVYIDIPQFAHLGYEEAFRQKAAAEGRQFERLEGSLRLIEGLLQGDWDPEEYLVVQPGQRTAGVYDFREVIRATDQ